MSRFHNLKMIKKLMLGFALLAFALLLMGYMGLRNMKQINEGMSDLNDLDLRGLSYVLAMQNQTRTIGRSVAAAIGAGEKAEMEKQSQIFSKRQAELQRTLAQIKATVVRDEEKIKFAQAEKAFGDLMQRYNEALQLALADKDKETQATASKARELRDQADPLMDELVDAKLKGAEQSAKAAEALYRSSRNFMAGVIVAGVWVAIGMGYFIASRITKALNHAVETMNLAASGDLTVRMEVSSRDEIGAMGLSLNRLLAALENSLRSIGRNAHGLASSAEELTAVSQHMAGDAEQTSAQAGTVSAASEQVTRNVQTAATGTEEMGASIKEIAKNATEAAKVAYNAVQVAEKTNATVSKLGASSAEIGQVIKVINSIAEQTNLLALNATIEAARAGEAGKGFAVVANEVKELAKQTGKATEDISQRIQSIQASTQGAVEAIEQIRGVINQINDISNTIASAVEEQSVTTNEISRNVAEAAKGASEISQNVAGVSAAAKSTSSGASDTRTAAQELARMAAELQSLVGQFKYEGETGSDAGGMSAKRLAPRHAYRGAATLRRRGKPYKRAGEGLCAEL